MGLFGMFGGKKDGAALEGEMGPGMVNMVAGMPGMMRKQMMRGRINQLLTLSEERRQQTIVGMFTGFHSPKVKEKNRHKVIATRVEIIGELSEDKRRTIMTSRVAALKATPELEKADRKVQEAVLVKVNDKARRAFLTTWDSVHKPSQN
ncbi:MAG: hypothetical protein V3V35_07490 [Dehalococcoidia bacterium]